MTKQQQLLNQPSNLGTRFGLVAAWTFIEKNTITVGFNFEYPGIDQQETIVHEVFHLYFGGNHRKIASSLNLGDFKDERSAEAALDKWLSSDCGHR